MSPLTPSPGDSKPDDFDLDILDPDDKDMLDLTTPIKDKGKDKDKDKEDKDELDEDDEDKDGKDKDDKDDKDKKDEDDDIEDELKDLEDELEDPDEEKLELTSPVPRREILKKYPEIFKDFPYLEKAYYREQQFTNIFPTIDDAKAAAEANQVLERYTDDMIEQGNTQNVLKMIKDNNPETFAKVVDNYLENLRKVDEGAHLHVMGNVIKHVIIDMVKEAKESGDDDLRIAALLLNKHVFHSSKLTPPTKLAKEESKDSGKKDSDISERERAFLKRQVDTAVSEVSSSVNSTITAAINKHIDPKGSMTDYVRRNAARDAMEKITSLIDKDVRFKKIVDGLYEKAAAANFSKESQDKIKKAYLSKAKSLLAPVLKSARNEALKGMGKRVKEDVKDNDKDDIKDDDKPQRQNERRLSSDKQKAKLDELKGMSSLEALNAMMGD
jgi:hypothetical protein